MFHAPRFNFSLPDSGRSQANPSVGDLTQAAQRPVTRAFEIHRALSVTLISDPHCSQSFVQSKIPHPTFDDSPAN